MEFLLILALALVIITVLIAKIKKLKKQLETAILRDSDTGLINKKGLLAFGKPLFALSKRQERPISIIYIDLDEFKAINDTYGHEFGDHSVLYFSNILLEVCREYDLVCRVGGDEFVILLPNTSKVYALNRIKKEIF